MSAPTHEKPATEQPTQPLPLPHEYPRGLRSTVWIPGTIVTAIGAGEGIRTYLLLTDTARSDFAIVVLLLVVAAAAVVMVCGQLLNSRDGRGR